MSDILTDLYCFVDDFWKIFAPEWEKHLIDNRLKKRKRHSELSISEIMTIIVHFHQSHYRNFKHYYLQNVLLHFKHYFPKAVSYSRFITLMKSAFVPLMFLMHLLKGEKTGVYFTDSTPIRACHIKRSNQNRVFKDLARKAKSTIGWFFGFKLHLVINDKGEIMAFQFTVANIDDRQPTLDLMKNLVGKLIGDRGYISKALSEQLLEQGVQLITRTRRNMKNKLISLFDKWLLRKRAIIESVNDQLKNISQIEHTRHRSIWNFSVNLLAALIAYSLQPKKPSISRDEFAELLVL